MYLLYTCSLLCSKYPLSTSLLSSVLVLHSPLVSPKIEKNLIPSPLDKLVQWMLPFLHDHVHVYKLELNLLQSSTEGPFPAERSLIDQRSFSRPRKCSLMHQRRTGK